MVINNSNNMNLEFKTSHSRDNILILDLNSNNTIIQFSKDGEKIIGYKQDDIIEKDFFKLLVPVNYHDKWKKTLYSARENKSIDDFKLPLLTNNDYVIMFSWSIFPVKFLNDKVGDIGLVGKMISDVVPDVGVEKKQLDVNNTRGYVKPIINKPSIKNDEKKILFNFGDKRIVFNSDSSTKSKIDSKDFKFKDVTKKEDRGKSNNKKTTSSFGIKNKIGFNKSKNGDFSDDLNTKNEQISNLERINNELVKENKKLLRKLQSYNNRKISSKSKNNLFSLSFNPKVFYKKALDNLSLFFGADEKKKELRKMMKELEEQKNLLDNLESQIIFDKKDLNLRRDEFCRWREKLVSLETEIENRRLELVDQEEIFKNNLFSALDEFENEIFNSDSVVVSSSLSDEKEIVDGSHDLIDKVSDSAVIVQRGVLKQVNESFSDLIGYSVDELVDKSLFDFIAPDGLSEIRQYYLDRLKGNENSSYETVLCSKDDVNISVEINVKPTIFDSQKAEMIVIKKILS